MDALVMLLPSSLCVYFISYCTGGGLGGPEKTLGNFPGSLHFNVLQSKCSATRRNRVRILVVEDEERLARAIRRVLEMESYQVDVAQDGAIAVALAQDSAYEVILLDVLLPVMNGFQVCRVLRESGNHTPIIMLTALGEVEDRVRGLDTGADDYLMKPFSFDELLARIRALLRRRPELVAESVLTVADLELDRLRHVVKRGDAVIELTPTEFRLLELLMRNPGQVLSRARILERVWGYAYEGESSIVETYIHYLRDKLDVKAKKKLIRTIRGVGYTMTDGA